MSDIAPLLQGALSGGSWLALPLALAGGVLTGLNPCCVALYPASAAACCASRCDKPKFAVSNAIAFTFGMALATAVLGVIAALAGRTMSALGPWVRYLVALVPLVMGAHMLGWIRLPLPKSPDAQQRRGIVGAFLAGFMLSLVIAPCGTPVLASVLSYAAYEGSVSYGALLLFVYGLGAGVPALAIGSAAGGLAQRLDRLGWRVRVDRAVGVALLGIGGYLLFANVIARGWL